MAWSENKTQPTPVPVAECPSGPTEARQAECAALNTLVERVVDPREHPVTVSAVAPHPTVADTWAFTTSLDSATFSECATTWNGPGSYAAGWAVDCEEPMVAILKGNAGMASVFTLGDRTPHTSPWSVMWSDINVPDDSADGYGSWLVVGHQRGGAWRGELSW